MSVDPLAADYAAWSPYNYVMGNPIKLIDPDGRAPEQPDDIIILINRQGAKGNGHMALLIGDDDNGWTFISKNGRDDSDRDGNQDGTMLTGGKSKQTIIEGEFDTLEEALSDKSSRNYEEGYRLKTTPDQDEEAVEVAKDSAFEDYHVLSDNCADTCSEALESAGYNGGTSPSVFIAPTSGTAYKSETKHCLLYTSPSPRDLSTSRMPSSA